MAEFRGKVEDAGVRFARRLSLQEYFVDFLGGLVPGVLFIAASAFIIVPPFHALCCALGTPESRKTLVECLSALLISTQNTPSTIWLALLLGMILLAYTIGHIFYRHDPKEPDRKSFLRLQKKLALYDKDELKANLACTSSEDCEFPYPYYHKYLERRGLGHLEPFVVWKEKKNLVHRSKTYVNLLKIRLRYHFPEKCGTIIRNEAHVRLASSTWYVSCLIVWLGASGVLLSVVSLIISTCFSEHFQSIAHALAWHVTAILLPLVTLAFALYLKWTILDFLHYQRLREVFFVLETAFTAFKDQFDPLKPPFDELPRKK